MIDYKLLVRQAYEGQKMAYAPYSNWVVGAALLTKSGKVYTGCNIENASYPATNCAERTAYFAAVSEGVKEFVTIAIVGGSDERAELDYCAPCGICRQVMREFCDPKKFEVVVAKSKTDYKVFTLEELLPESFGPENLGK